MLIYIETISNLIYIIFNGITIVNALDGGCMKISQLLTVEEAALRLGLKPCTIRRWILERRIDYVKNGRSVRIPQEAVERIITEGFRPAIQKEGTE